jgi:cytochrome c553
MMRRTRRDAQAARFLRGREGRLMKASARRSAWWLAVLAIAFPGLARAEETLSKQDVQAKLQYCEVCHGVSAQGYPGYYPIPRLAGQQVDYIKSQLQGFAEQKRTNNIMFNIGHVLSPAMITALATSFHDLDPKPLGGAPKELVAEGKKIYQEGVPSAKVAACASCHGQDAKGNGQFPRLAGQLYPYVSLQLTNWSKERGEALSSVMAPIARGLTDTQIRAVAAYVSYLE